MRRKMPAVGDLVRTTYSHLWREVACVHRRQSSFELRLPLSGVCIPVRLSAVAEIKTRAGRVLEAIER